MRKGGPFERVKRWLLTLNSISSDHDVEATVAAMDSPTRATTFLANMLGERMQRIEKAMDMLEDDEAWTAWTAIRVRDMRKEVFETLQGD